MIITLWIVAVLFAAMTLHCVLECWTLGKKYSQLEDDIIDMKAKYLQTHKEMGQLERGLSYVQSEEDEPGRYN